MAETELGRWIIRCAIVISACFTILSFSRAPRVHNDSTLIRSLFSLSPMCLVPKLDDDKSTRGEVKSFSLPTQSVNCGTIGPVVEHVHVRVLYISIRAADEKDTPPAH